MKHNPKDEVILTYRGRRCIFRLDEFDGSFWHGEIVDGDYLGDKIKVSPSNFDDAPNWSPESYQLALNPYQVAAEIAAKEAERAFETGVPVIVAQQVEQPELSAKEKRRLARELAASQKQDEEPNTTDMADELDSTDTSK